MLNQPPCPSFAEKDAGQFQLQYRISLFCTSMACKCCKSIDLDILASGKRVPHHASPKELETCSLVCQLCSWIWESLKKRLSKSRVSIASLEGRGVFCRVPGYTLDVADNHERWHGFKVVFFAVDIGGEDAALTDDFELFVPRGILFSSTRSNSLCKSMSIIVYLSGIEI